MIIVPDSKIILLKNPLKLDSNNEITFADATAQYNYFYSLPKLEYTGMTYIRKDGVIRVDTKPSESTTPPSTTPSQSVPTFEDLLQYNFCMYQNTHFSNKWFYAFITDITWINPSMTEIKIETAYYQTWQFDLVYADSFIEREHVNDDTIGKHTIPEGLETGEYVQAKQPGMLNSYEEYWICLGITELPPAFDQIIQSDRVFNGIYSGLIYLVFKTAGDITTFIKACDAAGKADAINSVFMIPSSLCTNPSWIHGTIDSYSFDFTWIDDSNSETTLAATSTFNRPTYLDINYAPKNNKLFTYPFSYCYVTNNCGVDVIYRYEDWISGYPKFKIVGSISPGCSIRCFPLDYKSMADTTGTSNSYNYGLNSGKFPICSWNSDVYTNWLTQQSVNMMLGDTRDYISLAGSVFTGNIGGAVSSFNNIIDRVAQKYEYSYTPNQAKGNTNSGDVTFIDSDDRISKNFFPLIYEVLNNYESDIFITDFYINHSKFDNDGLKNHVTGVIYKTELIKDIRFNENRNYAEDMEFNQEVRKLNPTIEYIPAAYYYNYGANKDCLTYKFSRGELNEFKEGSDV